jgi:hypothetical protein
VDEVEVEVGVDYRGLYRREQLDPSPVLDMLVPVPRWRMMQERAFSPDAVDWLGYGSVLCSFLCSSPLLSSKPKPWPKRGCLLQYRYREET